MALDDITILENEEITDQPTQNELIQDDDLGEEEYEPPKKLSKKEREEFESMCGIMGCKFSSAETIPMKKHWLEAHFVGPNFHPGKNQHLRPHYDIIEPGPNLNCYRKRACKLCDFSTVQTKNIEEHVGLVHFPHLKPVSCPVCPSKFQHTNLLRNHMLVSRS